MPCAYLERMPTEERKQEMAFITDKVSFAQAVARARVPRTLEASGIERKVYDVS